MCLALDCSISSSIRISPTFSSSGVLRLVLRASPPSVSLRWCRGNTYPTGDYNAPSCLLPIQTQLESTGIALLRLKSTAVACDESRLNMLAEEAPYMSHCVVKNAFLSSLRVLELTSPASKWHLRNEYTKRQQPLERHSAPLIAMTIEKLTL